MSNAVTSSGNINKILPDALLESISGFVNNYDCAQAMRVCKVWRALFTPYNSMLYSGEMVVDWLAQTCPPRDRPNVYYQGVRYDMEHANLRRSAAYQLIANAPNRAFTSLQLCLSTPDHISAARRLFESSNLSSLTNLYAGSNLSRELLQSIQKGCPHLQSITFASYGLIGAEALCEELNACKSLTQTTLHTVDADDDLQKLQKMSSLTHLQLDGMGHSTTAAGLSHLSEGYPALRMLSLSGGRAENQPVLLARPWVQRLVELESLAFRLLGLRLGHLTSAESACLGTQFLSKAAKLQEFALNSSELAPGCAEQLPKCPSLTALSITYPSKNSGITEATLQSVAQCAKLRFLTLHIPNSVDFGKALEPLAAHQTLEDLEVVQNQLGFSPKPELRKTASAQLVSVAKRMPALRVLEIPEELHPFVVQALPHHNVYVRSGPGREKYKLVPMPTK